MTQTLSRREAAAYAGVHYNTIRLWEQRGRLEPERVTVNGVEEVRIPIAQLEELMQERDEVTTARSRPRPTFTSPENARLWAALEKLEVENSKLSTRCQLLEQENSTLRERLEANEAERERLLTKLIEIVGE